MAKHLEELRRNNDVTVLCFEQGDACEEDGERECLHINNAAKAAAALTHPKLPLLFSIRSSRKFFEKICSIIDEKHIEAVHIEYSAMAQYAEMIKNRYPRMPVNVLVHDVTIQGYERMVENSKGIKKALLKNQKDKVEK